MMKRIKAARAFMAEVAGGADATRERVRQMLDVAGNRLAALDFTQAGLALREAERTIERAYL